MKNEKSIVMWDLGNECNCMAPVDNEFEAYGWTATVADAATVYNTLGGAADDAEVPGNLTVDGLTGGDVIGVNTNATGCGHVTLTNIDDRVSRMTEPGAPLPSDRLRTVRELCDSGIDTVVLIAPVMSSLEGHEEELVRRIADTGVRKVTCDPLNTRNVDTSRLDRMGIGRSVTAMEKLIHHGRSHGLDISDDY